MNIKLVGKNILRILLIIGILFWMMVIFGFSSADGEASQSTSDKITEVIVEKIYDDYNEMPIERQQKIWDNTSFIVRKTGHFGEYAILAVLISSLLLTYEVFRKNKKLLIVTVIISGIYAVTDEVHQGFVAGRSPKVMDVCIDSAGGFCGMLFMVIVSKIYERISTIK